MTGTQEEGKKTFLGLLEGPLGDAIEFEYEYGAPVSNLVRAARKLWEPNSTRWGGRIEYRCAILRKNEKGVYTWLEESEPIPLPIPGDTYEEKYSIVLKAAFETYGG